VREVFRAHMPDLMLLGPADSLPLGLHGLLSQERLGAGRGSGSPAAASPSPGVAARFVPGFVRDSMPSVLRALDSQAAAASAAAAGDIAVLRVDLDM